VNVAQTRAVEIGRGNAVSDAGVKDASMLTRDGDIVDVRLVVQYQVKSPTDFLFQAADPDRSVAQAAQAAVRAFVGTQSTDAVLSANRDALGVQLADAIKRALERDRTGLAVTGVAVQRIDPPQQVQAAFEDVARARADRERAKREAQAYANDIVPRAKTDGERAVEDAKTYAARTVADARSDAERFKAAYAQYTKAPAVVRERMYRDTMRDIYSNSRKVFVSGKGGATVNVTLENAASAAQAAAAPASASTSASAAAAPAAASAAPTPASQAAAASDAMRSRDTLRSRAREDDLQQ
jgi:membrane protease subunit HflK